MNLGELIKALEAADPNTVAPIGLGRAHSYRGYYEDLAFEPKVNVSVTEMLDEARGAMGRTFSGYKGGEYVMKEWTDVWLAPYGGEGEGIGPVLLGFMLGDVEAVKRALEHR
jgi:hypothetical protein